MADVESGPERDSGSRRRALLKLGALVALVAAGVLVARVTPLGEYLSREGIGRGIAFLRGSTWAPVIFVAVYAGATAVAIPGTVLTLAGGALFGTFWGTVFNSIGANIGANAAFLISRVLGRDGVKRLLGDRLDKLDKATREHGFRGLLTLRLVPLIPFNALNFGSGLTAMSWGVYALSTLIGILPGTIVYTMFADALLQGSQEASREAFIRVLISGGLLVLLSFLPTILKKLNVSLPVRTKGEEAGGGSGGSPGGGGVGGGAAGVVALLGVVLLAGPARAGDGVSPVQEALPDHGTFTELLQEVVHEDLVDYQALQARRELLDRYLEELASADPGTLGPEAEDERLAFWINAYNACMLKLVADHYPIEKSGSLLGRLKNTVAGRPANSVWQIEDVFTREHCRVAGEPRSQDEIEHEIIRPMGEPRIHFAVNCAALSCPRLADEAYTGERLDEQLDRQVELFLGRPEHFRIVERGQDPTIRVNKVLDWFGEDFGGPEGVKEFLAGYLSGEEAELVAGAETDVEYFEYDWTLNDVER